MVDGDGRDEADWRFEYVHRMDDGRRGSEVIRSGRIQMALCLAREGRWATTCALPSSPLS